MVTSLAIAMVVGADSAPIHLGKVYSREELPVERITGLTVTGSKWIVGGIRGLYTGSPGGKWTRVNDQAIRQVVLVKGMTWALYGNGAVDKLDVANDHLYSDTLNGAVKRPWVGAVSVVGDRLLFGGSGGWFEKVGDKSLTESYPKELERRSVTAMAMTGNDKLVGTQDGLFVFGSSKPKRFGFGNGLADVWVTSLVSDGGRVVVGTYTGGLYSYAQGSLKTLKAPSSKIRVLSSWRGRTVLGGLEGSWIQTGHGWTPLTKGETTFVTQVGDVLMVGTTESVSVFK